MVYAGSTLVTVMRESAGPWKEAAFSLPARPPKAQRP
jgi:hypothetical protein